MSYQQFLQRATCLSIAVVLLATTGCNRADASRARVTGAVTLDGKPMVQGAIKFTPMPGTPGAVTGTEIKDGLYELPQATGAAIGSNRVEITAMRKTGKMVASPLGPPGSMVEMEESAVAPRFNTSSKLRAEIKPGENPLDFTVESK